MAESNHKKQKYEAMDYVVVSGGEPLVLEEAVAEAVRHGFRLYGGMSTTSDPRVLYQPMVKSGSLLDRAKN